MMGRAAPHLSASRWGSVTATARGLTRREPGRPESAPPASKGQRASPRCDASPEEWLIRIVSTIYVVALMFGVATGRVPVRDKRGRLRPAPAALASVLALVLAGVVLTAPLRMTTAAFAW
jgi:hypothetical protein